MVAKYTRKYLEGRNTSEIFLRLNEGRLFLGTSKYCTREEFCDMICREKRVLEDAITRDLVVFNTPEDMDSLIDVKRTYDKMRAYFIDMSNKMARKKEIDKNINNMKSKHNSVAISVHVDPEDVDKIKTPITRPDEMKELERKWVLIAGDKVKMPNLQDRMVKRLLWNLRGLEITKMLLDGKPNESILIHMMDQWMLSFKQSKQIILRIEKSISKSVDKSKSLMVGTAYMRYERIYYKLFSAKDYKSAAVVNKQIVELFGIDVMAKEMKESGESAEDGHLAILDAIEKGQKQEAIPPPEETKAEEPSETEELLEALEPGAEIESPEQISDSFPDDDN